MRVRIGVAVILVGLACLPLALRAAQTSNDTYEPARAIAVSDVGLPHAYPDEGTLVLDVTVANDGSVRDIQVRRGLEAETEPAVSMVNTWKFQPARFNGKPVTSRVTVAVTFDPQPPRYQDVPLPPLLPDHAPTPVLGYAPPDVTYASFPVYPSKAYQPKTVILQSLVNEAGDIRTPEVLLDSPPFTPEALQAIQNWTFTPAMVGSEPANGSVVLVFCFQLPLNIPPPQNGSTASSDQQSPGHCRR